MLDKTYDAASVEPIIRERWVGADAFRAGAGSEPGAEPFSIVIPPPNVTGSLHMGHALNNTLQDVLVRFERMRGKDVLWQPGMDHAGIATQMVVERRMMERQEPDRRAIGRDAFVEKIWAWKAESGGMIVNQLKRLGASCDWSRERFTMDEGLSRAVVKVFVALYRDGLIYRDKRLVNWDPKLLTAISDLEVQPVEVQGHLWHFRYPVEGEDRFITVATTRPETMLGDTAVAVHPDDERYRGLIGKTVVLPLVGRRIPIIADEYADPEAGSGAVKITPAHDFNDFEVGRRHGLRLVSIMDAEANIVLRGNADFLHDVPPSSELSRTVDELDGLDRFTARASVVAMMAERELLQATVEHTHTVPHGDRSAVPIEPLLMDQWYVDAKALAAPAIASVREGRTVFVPKSWEKTYFDWMENIQPWCISRQLWWGHRIPAWYGPDGRIFVEESEAEAQAAAGRHYGEAVALRRDEDVLDTWFSSALWPFATLGWPDDAEFVSSTVRPEPVEGRSSSSSPEKEDSGGLRQAQAERGGMTGGTWSPKPGTALARHYPNDVLVSGFDIIFFWDARMAMQGFQFMGEKPWKTLYLHGLVRDAKGQKMSKSKGNTVDPLGLIDRYGADALRFTLAAMESQGRDIKLDEKRVEGYRNFATKLWNAARFCQMNECRLVEGFDPAGVEQTLNRWIRGEAARTAAAVTDALEDCAFDDAAEALYRFIWNTFCDWYLELAKPVLAGTDEAAKTETRATAAWALDQACLLLHPISPFVTEELWGRLAEAAGVRRSTLLIAAAWPELPESWIDADAAAEIDWLIGLVTEVRSIRAEMNVPPSARPALALTDAGHATLQRLERHRELLTSLARLSSAEPAGAVPPGAVPFVLGEATGALSIAEFIDVAAERARLAKAAAAEEAEAAKVRRKLDNADFVARAPAEVVEENRARLAESEAAAAKLRVALDRLEGLG